MILAELIKKGSLTKAEGTERDVNSSNCSRNSISRVLTKEKKEYNNNNNINRLCESNLSEGIKVQNVAEPVATATVATFATVQRCLGEPCEHSRYQNMGDNVLFLWCSHLDEAVIDIQGCPFSYWKKDERGFPLPHHRCSK